MIKDVLKSVFLKIANKLGLKLQEKTDTAVDFSASGLNPTAIGAAVIANISIDDSDIIIEGENARAKAICDIRDYFQNEVETAAAEVALATGDCLVRPFTDGEYIGLNIIGGDSFIVTESIGGFLKGVIMKIDEYKINSDIYRLFESQTIKNTESGKLVYIRRFAFKNEEETDISSTNWKDIQTEVVISAEQLLLGRYKCPTLNRKDYNSANGVPITFGCEGIIENIRKKYDQYNDEFDRKEAVIFADRSLFRTEKGEDGSKKLVRNGKEYVTITGSSVDGGIQNQIKDYSPDIREAEFKAGLDLNFSVLEMCCGFSRGIFTTPETAFATATEMKNSLKKSFSFVKRFRKYIESGNKMLFNAVNIIMNLNGMTPLGDWDIRHDWSYDYIEQTVEKFNQLLQAHAAGCLKDETLTGWVLGIDEEKAKKYISELKQAGYGTDDLEDEQAA